MAKELKVEEKLKYLYELQKVDSKINEIEILKGELPMEVQDLADSITAMEGRIDKQKVQVEDFQGQIAMYKANITEAEGLITRYEKQLDEVKNNREYDALTKELELARLDIQLAEKRIRDTTAKLDNKAETIGANEEKLSSKKEDLTLKKKELEEIITKTEKEEEKLNKKRERSQKKIVGDLNDRYERIRNQYKNGLAVVFIERDSCGGCFNSVPPQIQLEISLRQRIIDCEHCGRILVDDHIETSLEKLALKQEAAQEG
ncbi:MAG: C4-type zinc ribbon domain-containing protein [Saprospiraceae bacterium]|nr:C4-type zinc ribbon domain-containing protein [Saprospiraceae bacterium]